MIIIVLSTVVSLSSDKIGIKTVIVVVGVILHNALGLIGGYWGGRLFGFDKSICRTLSLEVGMQNSGLAAVLGSEFLVRWLLYRAQYFHYGIIFPVHFSPATGRESLQVQVTTM